jgi:hypothetical protein
MDIASPHSTEQLLKSRKTTMSRTYTATEERPTRTLLPTHDTEIYTIDELIKRRASELRDSPLIGYPKVGVTDYEEHSAFAVNKYADAAAEALQRKGLKKVVSQDFAQTELPLIQVTGFFARQGSCRCHFGPLWTSLHHYIAGSEQAWLCQPFALNPAGRSSPDSPT